MQRMLLEMRIVRCRRRISEYVLTTSRRTLDIPKMDREDGRCQTILFGAKQTHAMDLRGIFIKQTYVFFFGSMLGYR